MKRDWKIGLLAVLVLEFVAAVWAASSSQETQLQLKKIDQEIQAVHAQLVQFPQQSRRHLSVLYYNKAVLIYESQKNAQESKRLLTQSIQYDPNNAQAYELLGDFYYLEQDMTRAQQNYKTAYHLDPRNERLKTKLNRLGEEKGVEEKLGKYRSEHFIIRYAKDQRLYEGYQLRLLLDEAYQRVGKDFNYYPPGQVTVLLYSEADYRQLTRGLEWTVGIYDGKIRLSGEESKDETSLRKLIYHEYTHALLHALTMGRCPVWLQEGLALVEESQVKPYDVSGVKVAVSQNQLFPLKTFLYLQPGQLPTIGAIKLFYDQAYSFTSYLVEKYRFYQIYKILTSIRDGMSFEEVIQRLFHVTLDRLEREWKSAL